jgi:hypothetical protein
MRWILFASEFCWRGGLFESLTEGERQYHRTLSETKVAYKGCPMTYHKRTDTIARVTLAHHNRRPPKLNAAVSGRCEGNASDGG